VESREVYSLQGTSAADIRHDPGRLNFTDTRDRLDFRISVSHHDVRSDSEHTIVGIDQEEGSRFRNREIEVG
jgi:hypothetical protein